MSANPSKKASPPTIAPLSESASTLPCTASLPALASSNTKAPTEKSSSTPRRPLTQSNPAASRQPALATDLNAPEERKRALYAAFASGDARFDGQVFVGVSSTGIYCRTVCTAKMPKFENCTFFRNAAEAEAAGYRPCLTCRPETAPGISNVDACANLARRAATLIRDKCSSRQSIEEIACKLGYTGRHLRRAFSEEYGVSPSQYALTCRLLLAKSILTDSDLPVSLVAQAAGFGSTRRFNDAFKHHYRLTPTQLRSRKGEARKPTGQITVKIGYRPPYRFNELLSFFRTRALQGVEMIEDDCYLRTVRICKPDGPIAEGWVCISNEEHANQLKVTMPDSLVSCIPEIVARVRRMFDTDCNPLSVSAGLSTLNSILPGVVQEGIRLPGSFDPFETACRAVLGQQISVAAANKIAARIVARFGEPVDTGIQDLTHAWPTAAQIIALAPLENVFGACGVIKTRSHVIAEMARMIESHELVFGVEAPIEEQMEHLLSIKGVGPWTANYIAMRTLCHPDAFLETDAGVAHALPMLTPKQRSALAESWHPWRSYAVINLWNSLSD